MEFYKFLFFIFVGKKFEIRCKVIGVYDKGKLGFVVEIQSDFVEVIIGEVYFCEIGSVFFIGQGNWGGFKGLVIENFLLLKGKQLDVVFEYQIIKEFVFLYCFNGDYNFFYVIFEFGKKMGFGGVIMYGFYSWNVICYVIFKLFGGGDLVNIKDYQVCFVSLVFFGDKFVISVWRIGEKKGEWEEICFVVQVEGGKVCFSNGCVLMKCVGDVKSKL